MVESNGKTVLILDHEAAPTELFTSLLRSHGYATQIAASGQEALESASSSAIDLILIDRTLPDLEGLKVYRQLKANSKTSTIPIMIISSSPNKNEGIESLYLGADDYLTRPFDPEDLFARIDVVLRRHQASPQDHRDGAIISELRRIINEEAINVYYQPIYFLKPMRLLGLEMFSRPKTTGMMLNPEVFFKLALKHGVYFEAEMIGWNKALQTVSNVFDGRQKLFLNCDPCLLEGQRFKDVKGMFLNHRMPPNEVFLEITERSAVAAYNTFFQRLKEYRFDGFKFAIDDLGAGYSSLEAIIEIRPEAVKLDRHIIHGLSQDPYKKSIVRLIVAFCRENNIICIAEGIEDKEDFDCLIQLDVDAGQGYYLCRPTKTLDLPAMQALDFS